MELQYAENYLLLSPVRHLLLTDYFLLSTAFSSFIPLLAIKYASMN